MPFVCLVPVRLSLQHGGFVPREWLAAEGLFTMTRPVGRAMKSVIPSRVCHEVLVNLTFEKRLSFVQITF